MKPFGARKFMLDAATDDLRPYIGEQQLAVMLDLSKGEEGDWFVGRMVELAALIHAMPKVYGQESLGEDAIAHLHYFHRRSDWYITERDMDGPQYQAFGLADLFGGGGELGYISIPEITAAGAELDLHWTPRTLASIRAMAKA